MIVIMRVVILPFVMAPCVFCVWSHRRQTLTQRTVIWTPLPVHHSTDKQPSSPQQKVGGLRVRIQALLLVWVQLDNE